MNQAAADGGGGGGVGSLVVDHTTLAGVSQSLDTAGGDLDQCGTTVPSTGDMGEAAVLMTAILAAVTEAGGRLAFEAKTLSAVVSECNEAAASADRTAAESYLVGG